jgi:hypothetical protein
VLALAHVCREWLSVGIWGSAPIVGHQRAQGYSTMWEIPRDQIPTSWRGRKGLPSKDLRGADITMWENSWGYKEQRRRGRCALR